VRTWEYARPDFFKWMGLFVLSSWQLKSLCNYTECERHSNSTVLLALLCCWVRTLLSGWTTSNDDEEKCSNELCEYCPPERHGLSQTCCGRTTTAICLGQPAADNPSTAGHRRSRDLHKTAGSRRAASLLEVESSVFNGITQSSRTWWQPPDEALPGRGHTTAKRCDAGLDANIQLPTTDWRHFRFRGYVPNNESSVNFTAFLALSLTLGSSVTVNCNSQIYTYRLLSEKRHECNITEKRSCIMSRDTLTSLLIGCSLSAGAQ